MEKKVYVTATKGMASLQFPNATNNSAAGVGYGNGHKDVHQLVQQILTNPSYADIKQRILECDCLDYQ